MAFYSVMMTVYAVEQDQPKTFIKIRHLISKGV